MADTPTKTPSFGRNRGNMGKPIEKAENVGATLKRLLSFFRSETLFVSVMGIVVLICVIASVIAPSFQSSAIDQIVSGNFGRLPHFLVLMLITYLIHGAATLAQGYLSASLSQRIVSKLRKTLFDKIVHLPISYLDSHSHGDLISRMTNDVENISGIISSSLSSLFSGVLTLIGTSIMNSSHIGSSSSILAYLL